jgi:hypothetical protein
MRPTPRGFDDNKTLWYWQARAMEDALGVTLPDSVLRDMTAYMAVKNADFDDSIEVGVSNRVIASKRTGEREARMNPTSKRGLRYRGDYASLVKAAKNDILAVLDSEDPLTTLKETTRGFDVFLYNQLGTNGKLATDSDGRSVSSEPKKGVDTLQFIKLRDLTDEEAEATLAFYQKCEANVRS